MNFSLELFTTTIHLIEFIVAEFNLAVNLTPASTEPPWIIEVIRSRKTAYSRKARDGLALTLVWECSQGKFNWYCDVDEIILIPEGAIVLDNDTMRPTRYGPGDVIFFNDDAHARWHVEGRVKKLAFCRKTQSVLLSFALRLLCVIRNLLASEIIGPFAGTSLHPAHSDWRHLIARSSRRRRQ